MEKLISEHSEPVKRELRAYIADWERFSMKKYDPISRTCFLAKYGELSIYDAVMEKIYSIDDKEIHFVKGYGYALIVTPDHTDGTSTDHEYFFIDDHLFDRILETDQNYDIIVKVIHKESSFSSINVKRSNSISEKNSISEMVTPRHQLQRKRHKKVHGYSQK